MYAEKVVKKGDAAEQSDTSALGKLPKRAAGLCGHIFPPPLFRRVIHGQASLHSGDWPWVLSIKVLGQHSCGASLISDEWAVTAAHCFFFPNDPMNRMVNLQTIDVVAGTKSTAGFGGVAYKVASVFIHPQYIPNLKPPSPFDIALIRLAGKVLNIPPACLPAMGSPITSNLCGIAGWGHATTPIKLSPPVLQETLLPIQEPFKCHNIDPVIQLCAGGGGQSACTGDSGGPLLCFDNGIWVLEGITSWGTGDCFPFQPSVYTRTNVYHSSQQFRRALNLEYALFHKAYEFFGFIL
ncbi:chymotrypsinogen B-like [Montipora capricornis]|uniref:chymotrypsinogen B-like n=1 Tax=Montipora capricornis TaxID=246305 RepID=UPI0035F11869